MPQETLMASRYQIVEERPSEIDATYTLRVVTGMYCPKCGNVLPELGHGKAQICEQCGLWMQRYGNALECKT